MNYNFHKYLIVLVMTLVLNIGYSQQQVISFEYDNSGNRVLREVIEIPAAPLANDSTTVNVEGPKSKKSSDSIAPVNPVLSSLPDGREVNIYPNPTRGQLLIEISEIKEGESGKLLILSMEGKIIEQRAIKDKTIHVDLSRQARGNYILRLRLGEQKKEWQIVKQ